MCLSVCNVGHWRGGGGGDRWGLLKKGDEKRTWISLLGYTLLLDCVLSLTIYSSVSFIGLKNKHPNKKYKSLSQMNYISSTNNNTAKIKVLKSVIFTSICNDVGFCTISLAPSISHQPRYWATLPTNGQLHWKTSLAFFRFCLILKPWSPWFAPTSLIPRSHPP